MNNPLLKGSPPKTRHLRFIHGPIRRNANPVLDLLGCRESGLRREMVQHAELVVGAEEAPCVSSWAVGVEWEGAEGRVGLFFSGGGHFVGWEIYSWGEELGCKGGKENGKIGGGGRSQCIRKIISESRVLMCDTVVMKCGVIE